MAGFTIMIAAVLLGVGAHAAKDYGDYKKIDQLLRLNVFDDSYDDNMKEIHKLLDDETSRKPPQEPWTIPSASLAPTLENLVRIEISIRENDCRDQTYRRVRELVDKDFVNIEPYERVHGLLNELVKRYAQGCIPKRIEAAPKVIALLEKIVTKRVENFGRHALAWYSDQPTDILRAATVKELLSTREMSYELVLAVYDAMRAQGKKEGDVKHFLFKDIALSDLVIHKPKSNRTCTSCFIKPFKKLFETKYVREIAEGFFTSYIYSPCSAYRAQTAIVFEKALWEAEFYEVDYYYEGNESFYRSLSNYHFCGFVCSSDFRKLFQVFVKQNLHKDPK